MIEHRTPHLTTAMTGALYLLERQLLDHQAIIENWFNDQWQLTPPPVYGSVDLRNAGFKLAPVDMNLFPAGFNNLNEDFFPLLVEAAKTTLSQAAPNAQRILLIAESHTRNIFYWDNVSVIKKILTSAGFTVRVGSLKEDLTAPQSITLTHGSTILMEPINRLNDKLVVNDFVADVIFLNNDLAEGIPEILTHLQQIILPPPELGWSLRSKSNHFQYYQEVSQAFAKLIKIDPWFIAPFFRHCGEIDFMQREGEECLMHHAEQLFIEIEKKYKEYQIDCDPFIIIKADAGTYGMAVMTVRNVEEIRTLNRKQRTRMSMTKGGKPVHKVILQEGIYTFETWGPENSVAEPVVYLWGKQVVGGFYRVHQGRGIDENLNSPGMQFEPLAFEKTCHEPIHSAHPDECQNRFYAYGVIARLSMLAAAREMKEQTA